MSSLVAIGSLLAAVPAHALSFTWQFIPTSGPTGANSYVVKGTIDGLAIGANSGSGITATVTDTPTGGLLGTYLFFTTPLGVGGTAFTVDASGNNITFADAVFTSDGSIDGNTLIFGLNGGANPPFLYDQPNFSSIWTLSGGQTTFSSAPSAVPFDFSPAPAVVILGGIFAAKKLRNKLVEK